MFTQDSLTVFLSCCLQENALYDPGRMNAFQCDVTYDKLTTHVCEESIDIVTVIFVLSSISPEKMLSALENIATVSVKLLVFFKGDQLCRVPYHSREYTVRT